MKTKITSILSLLILGFVIACSSGGDDSGPSCGKVENVYFYTTPTSVQLYYSEGANANSFRIEYGPTGFTQGSGTSFTTSSTEYTISNLNPSTTYDFYIKGICSDSETSAAYKLSSVTTDASQCTQNTSVQFFDMGSGELAMEFSYPGGEVYDYQFEYGPQGFTLGSGTRMDVEGTTSFTISGLSPSTTYDVYVRAMCSQGDYAPFKKFSYTTQTTCPKPVNLNSWLISGSCNSGTAYRGFSWQYPFASAENYEISLITSVGQSAESGSIDVTSNTSIGYTGMYCIWKGFYVRANCGGGDYSDWAGPYYW